MTNGVGNLWKWGYEWIWHDWLYLTISDHLTIFETIYLNLNGIFQISFDYIWPSQRATAGSLACQPSCNFCPAPLDHWCFRASRSQSEWQGRNRWTIGCGFVGKKNVKKTIHRQTYGTAAHQAHLLKSFKVPPSTNLYIQRTMVWQWNMKLFRSGTVLKHWSNLTKLSVWVKIGQNSNNKYPKVWYPPVN